MRTINVQGDAEVFVIEDGQIKRTGFIVSKGTLVEIYPPLILSSVFQEWPVFPFQLIGVRDGEELEVEMFLFPQQMGIAKEHLYH